MAVDELVSLCNRPSVSYETITRGLDDIETTLRRELSVPEVLVLNSQEQRYFDPNEPLFGSEVADKYPTEAAFEIDEAAKFVLGAAYAARLL